MLKSLAERCRDRGMSFVAVVEYAPGEYGRTVALSGTQDFHMTMLEALARSSSIDGFAISVARYVREHKIPHNSIVLAHLGVPAEPAP